MTYPSPLPRLRSISAALAVVVAAAVSLAGASACSSSPSCDVVANCPALTGMTLADATRGGRNSPTCGATEQQDSWLGENGSHDFVAWFQGDRMCNCEIVDGLLADCGHVGDTGDGGADGSGE